MKKLISLLLLTVLMASTVMASAGPAAQARQKAIDEFVLSQMELGQIPGLALGIVEDDGITYLNYGTLDGSGAPVTPDTPFEVGSVGKSLTALCIRQLANQGKIDYGAPVQTYIPWFTLADKEAASQIRIVDLIYHRSGLSTAAGGMAWSYNSKYTIEQAVWNMRNVMPDRPAGTSEEYCNLNFIILGLVVEKVSGISYSDYLHEHVFEPLQMNNSYPSRAEAGNATLAQGHYVAYSIALPNCTSVPTAQVPAGFQYLSARDLTSYAVLFLSNGYKDGRSIIPDNELPELSLPLPPPSYEDKRYNAYWRIESGKVPGNGYHGHAGASSGYTSVLLINNMERRAIVVLVNCRNTSTVPEITAQSIGNQIASILNTGKVPFPQRTTHPGLLNSLFFLAAALLLPLIRLVWASQFLKSLNGGGNRRRLTIIFFTLIDVLLPLSILIGLPIYFDNTWPYFLATSLETSLPPLVGAVLLASTGIIKALLMIKRKKTLTPKCSA